MSLGQLLCNAIKSDAPIAAVKQILDHMRATAALYKEWGTAVPEQDKATYTDKDSLTALHIAAAMDRVEVIDLLVKDGHISVDTINNQGETALMKAASEGMLYAVRLLLQFGADVNKVNVKKTAILHLAVEKESINVVIANVVLAELVRAGANVFYDEGNLPKNINNPHVLRILASGGLLACLKQDDFKKFNETLDKYPDVDIYFTNVDKESVYALAQKRENAEYLKLLAAKKLLKPEITPQERDSALLASAQQGHNDAVRYFLNKGAVLSVEVMQLIVVHCELEQIFPSVKVFAKAKVASTPTAVGSAGLPAVADLSTAQKDSKATVTTFAKPQLSQDVYNQLLIIAAAKGSIHNIVCLVKLWSADINARDAEQHTALSRVVQNAKDEMQAVEMLTGLFCLGATLDTAAVQCAIEKNYCKVLKEFLKLDRSKVVDVVDKNNRSALYLAVEANDTELVQQIANGEPKPAEETLAKAPHGQPSLMMHYYRWLDRYDIDEPVPRLTALLGLNVIIDAEIVYGAIKKNQLKLLIKLLQSKHRAKIIAIIDKNWTDIFCKAIENADVDLLKELQRCKSISSINDEAEKLKLTSALEKCVKRLFPDNLSVYLKNYFKEYNHLKVRNWEYRYNDQIRSYQHQEFDSRHAKLLEVLKVCLLFRIEAADSTIEYIIAKFPEFPALRAFLTFDQNGRIANTIAQGHTTAIYKAAEILNMQLLQSFKGNIARQIFLTIPDGKTRLPLAEALNTLYHGSLSSVATSDDCGEFIDRLLKLGAIVDDVALQVCLERMTSVHEFNNEKYHGYNYFALGCRISPFIVLNKILGAEPSQVIISDQALLSNALFFVFFDRINMEAVRYLASRVNINTVNKNGETYFHCAARISYFEQYKLVMETLLAQNPSIDILNTIPDLTCEEFDNKRYSVLEVAIKFAKNDEDAKKRVEILVNAGCTKYIAKAIEFAESKNFKNTLDYLKECKNELSRPKPKLKPVTDLCVQELSQYNAPIAKPLTLEQQRIALNAEIFTTDAKLLREQLVFAIRFGTDQDAIACVDKIQATHCYEVLLIEDASKKIPLQYVNAKQTDVINKLLEFSPYTQTKEKSKEADLLDFAAYILSLDKDSQPQKNKKVRNDIFCEILGFLKQSKLKEAIMVIQASIPKVHSRIKDNTCSAILRGILKRIGAEEKDAKAADNKSAQDNLKGLYEVLQHYNVRNKKFDFALIPAPVVVVAAKVNDAKQDDAGRTPLTSTAAGNNSAYSHPANIYSGGGSGGAPALPAPPPPSSAATPVASAAPQLIVRN